MNRRGFLAGVGGATAGVVSGCAGRETDPRTTGGGDESNNGTSKDPIATDNPWRGTILHLSGGSSSPEAIRTAFTADVPWILVGPSITTAFVATRNTDTAQEAAQDAGFDVHGVTGASWDGGPICDVRNWIQFPNEPGESTVREAFPNAIYILLNTSSGEETWEIYTPLISRDELSSRLGSLGVGSQTSIVTYGSCDTGESTSTDE